MRSQALKQVADLDIRLLRVFKTVVEAGSFAGAESALGITPSAISVHMSDLEARLGMRLCQRGRAGFALTDQGREVLRATETLLAAVEDFRGEINQLHRSLRGDLNVGLINNLVTEPRMQVTSALEFISRQSSEVRINLSMNTPSEIELGLMDGRMHVGVLPWIASLSGLEYRALYDEQSLLYCSERHPLFANASQASQHDLQAAATVAPNYPMSQQATALHQGLHCTATASNREAIAFLILSGQYIGFLPSHYAAAWVDKGQMAVLMPERMHFSVQLAIATRKGRRENQLLELFLTALEAQAGER
ncbi:LysR family transcriptional regulator [Lampropedia aestuarii]|uniref:LysR family transcriptional regulator n=1 Tax=Lampropedia aestuarii TaxID=2562762 RepID=A0A4S5BER9_9BURK|nr:LysR family transcriptional regulator [Lampropedia aestuarii]THJ30690.1 LysR family transcriptional regulator [Lampropedia aestuarii]